MDIKGFTQLGLCKMSEPRERTHDNSLDTKRLFNTIRVLQLVQLVFVFVSIVVSAHISWRYEDEDNIIITWMASSFPVPWIEILALFAVGYEHDRENIVDTTSQFMYWCFSIKFFVPLLIYLLYCIHSCTVKHINKENRTVYSKAVDLNCAIYWKVVLNLMIYWFVSCTVIFAAVAGYELHVDGCDGVNNVLYLVSVLLSPLFGIGCIYPIFFVAMTVDIFHEKCPEIAQIPHMWVMQWAFFWSVIWFLVILIICFKAYKFCREHAPHNKCCAICCNWTCIKPINCFFYTVCCCKPCNECNVEHVEVSVESVELVESVDDEEV